MQHLAPGNAKIYPEIVLHLQRQSNYRCCMSDFSAQDCQYDSLVQNCSSNDSLSIDYQREYFVLLHEVFGDVVDDFTYESPNGDLILTTARLYSTLKSWARKISALSFKDLLVELQRIEAAIQNVVSMLRPNDEDLEGHTDVSDDHWLLAISCMIEALDQARLSLPAMTDRPDSRHPLHCNARVKSLEMTMFRRGWCPNNIKMCQSVFGSSSLYYASLLPRSIQRAHDSCSSNHCLAYSTIKRSLVTTHPDETRDCNCKHLSTPTTLLARIVELGLTPLVYAETSRDEIVAINVVPYHASQTFVAISHVWSHGLGDGTRNSLRQCQIKRILQFIAPHSKPPFLFWLDTLCVPREPIPLRRKSIEGIRRVYEEASLVLAFDEELLATSVSGMGYEEILMRVHLSGWMRRLWTLHEQSRAKDIYFQFADGVFAQTDLIENFEKDVDAHKEAGVPFFKVVPTRGISLLKKLLRIKSGRHVRTTLVELWALLRWRHLSWPEDETICMANILGFSPGMVKELLNTPEEQRMRRFLELFTHFPAALLFLHTDKLRLNGWRWAPVSWVHCVQHLDELLNLRVRDDFLGLRSERGLIISCPAINLESNGYATLTRNRSIVVSLASMNNFFLVTIHYPDASSKLDATHPHRSQLAICLEHGFSPKHKRIRAVLVAVVESLTLNDQQMTYARFLFNLKLQRLQSPVASMSKAHESTAIASNNLKIALGAYSSPSCWCIG
ncbi:hypothetical protein BDU57DRAFT_508982 [Ampelomyces quisqualis]|uniref:Heterokaryon incompatibility domain-containing protein n=1 Tax=Ampelomyces quisqualis TaxID=50730 RepID=A0A6A5R0H1_AMPQU|nr:hypothetical protein BDU57DRAFT_508982 [Ampelomyces quisqualis]